MTAPAVQPVSAGRHGRPAETAIVCLCCLSMFMIAVDTTVVNLALPLISRGLHASVAGLQWTIAAYTITTASCSLTPDTGWLIAFRALQGAAGSTLTPMSMAVITATFTDPGARARAIGMWSGTWGVGMVTGPVLGGLLAAAWGWRSLFWINIVPGLAGIAAARVLIRDPRSARVRRLDPPAQMLVIVFLASLTYGIIEGPADGWRSAPILASFAASAIAVALLVPWERHRADPLIDLRVFRSLPFTGALVITVSSFACLAGFLFLTTLYLQDVRELTVLQAGIALMPLAATTAIAGPLAGRVMGRSGARGPLTFAGVTLTAACLMLAQAPSTASWGVLGAVDVVLGYLVFGAGYGAVNTVISAVAQAGLPPAQAGVAGGITSAGRQAGQSLGVSVTGAIFASALNGPVRDAFAAASHPAWLVIAACGLMVLLLGLVSTSRSAIRTAARVLPGVQAAELRADFVGLGLAHLVKDGERLLPGLSGP